MNLAKKLENKIGTLYIQIWIGFVEQTNVFFAKTNTSFFFCITTNTSFFKHLLKKNWGNNQIIFGLMHGINTI